MREHRVVMTRLSRAIWGKEEEKGEEMRKFKTRVFQSLAIDLY